MRVLSFDRYFSPYLLDISCGIRSIRHQREQVVPLVYGHILEVGIGTGLNLPHYDPLKVKTIIGLDPAQALQRLALKRVQHSGLAVELLVHSAEQLPFAAAQFDCILITYTLCTISDPLAALREMRRVIKPSGKLVFCEHGRAPNLRISRWQDRLTPYWQWLAGGCHLNRDIPALLQATGWICPELHTPVLPGPRVLAYHYWGEAFPGKK